jgi:hypothetical protein
MPQCPIKYLPYFFLSCLLVLTGVQINAQELPAVTISEFMSSNSNTISDEDGDFSDWIEIKNNSDAPIDLEGWGLSDNDGEPFKWVFPSVTLQPGQHFLVWASGKDRKPEQSGLLGGIRQEVFLDISGTSISHLTNSPNYPGNPSYVQRLTDLFEAPADVNDDYGQRLHGLLLAPETGNYTFWISSDDNSQLYLSTDEQPGNAVLIASVSEWTNSREWDKYASQQSDPIHLTAGEYYYISALMKEEGGGDNLAVGWQRPDATMQRPMPASHIYTAPGELHSSYAISADGEPLLLTNPQDEIIHLIEPVELASDLSYGLISGQEDFFYFSEPTPGQANTTSGYNEILSGSLTFSHTGGFYNSAIDLVIHSDDPGATIYYTLNGSEPDPENIDGTTYQYKNAYPGGGLLSRSSQTYVYEGPIAINDRSAEPYQVAGINTHYTTAPRHPTQNIYKGTVIRAKAVKPNALSPNIDTHTYFITPEGSNRYDLPVVSISTNEAHLFDYHSGIYVPGVYADEWVGNNSVNEWNDGEPANYNQRGDAWEKPAHFEYFPKNGDPVYKHDIGVRIHGGWSRAFYRKSLRLYARNAYGTGNTFTYPFFGDLPAKGDANRQVSDFRRLILRNSGNDYDNTLYRDALMQELAKDLPVATMAYHPVIHFINGEYWGIINMRERYDQYYLESHYAINADDAAILDAWGNVDQGIPEDRTQFLEIVDYAQNNDPANDAHFEWIMERIDMESLASYYAAQIYFYNSDWPQNNMTFWRYREGVYSPDAPIGHDGRWRWMLYDTDFGMNIWSSNQWYDGLARVINEATDPSSRIFIRLLRNTAFKNRFINIVTDQLNSCFSPAFIHQKVDAYNARLASSRSEHYNRWQSGTNTGAAMKTFASERPSYVLTHTGNQFGLTGGTALLTINRTGDGGKVSVNTLSIDSEMAGQPNPETPFPWSGSYFKNIPVTLTATNEPGYRFSHWLINGDRRNVNETEVTLTANTDVTAVFNAIDYQLIHYWHFNNLPEGLLSPLQADHTQLETQVSISYPGTGDGYMDRVNDGTDINAKNNFEAVRALRVRNPSDTRHLELFIPTKGFEDIRLSYAVTRTGSGAEYQNIWYRTSQSGAWVLFQESLLITETYQLVDLDFSDISAVENNDELSVKIEFTGAAASGTSGNNRFDNVAVEGYRFGTNINKTKESAILNIFPVPATNQLTIASSLPMTQVVLYNGQGQVLQRHATQGLSHQLNLSSLPPGIYIVEVATHNAVQRRKITRK